MLTNEEFDELILEVEREMVSLAKSADADAKLKKDDAEDEMAEEAAPEMAAAPEAPAEEAPAQEAPAMDAPAEEAAPEMDAAPAAEAPAEEAAPEQEAPAEEAQEQGLSMEDLVSIYSEMDEDEREAHYEALKQSMQQSWAKEAMEKQAMDEKEANGGEMIAPAAMAKEEEACEDKKEDEKKEDKEEMEKSEKEKQLEAAIETLVKSLETRLPARKAIVESGSDSSGETPISGKDLQKKALELTGRTDLSKTERSVLDAFFVLGKNEAEVQDLIKAKKA